ncbi:MAG: ABC transporter permease [Clostridia bacterium]|nr:ABC transporter permease [Clostridia bacterium]
MKAIYRREIQSYFYTPAAYVFMGVFLSLASIFFGVGNLAARSGNMLSFLSQMSYVWMLLSPVLTMRLIAGEKRQHTDQMLYSSPCSLTALVTGKFFAACTVLTAAVASCFIYALIVAIYGTLYLAETLVGFLGLLLQGCAFIALDLFISCFSRNQMTAAVAGMGVNLLVWFADVAASAISVKAISSALQFISLYQRFAPFTQGQLSLSNVFFNLAFIFIMLFLSVRVLDARRWSEA